MSSKSPVCELPGVPDLRPEFFLFVCVKDFLSLIQMGREGE